MTIRAKLLILLLCMALVPLAVLAAFSLWTADELGDQVGGHAREAMASRELARLEEKVSDAVVILRSQAETLEYLLHEQALAVQEALVAAGDGAVIRARDLDRGLVPTTEDSRYQRALPDGTLEPVPLALGEVAVRALPGAGATPDEARLASLRETYQRIRGVPSAGILWQYTALESGLHSVFPGHGGYPDTFDPRERAWYRGALASEGPSWSPPVVDVSTRKVVTTLSRSVIGPDGTLAGVTAIDVLLPELFRELPTRQEATSTRSPEDWHTRSEAMIVARDEAGVLHVNGRERPTASALSWDGPAPGELLDDPDGRLERAFVEAATAGEVGHLRHPLRGVDTLFAFERIRPGGAYLVLTTPVASVVAHAEELEGFVTDRFGQQAGFFAVALLAIAAVAGAVARRAARNVTRPLEELSMAAGHIAAGELDSRAQLRRTDEIGQLADSVNHMADSIQKLVLAQEDAFLQAMKSLMRALEKKDRYTAGHSGRVKRYSLRLGRRIQLDDATLDVLGRGALVHDLGKIGIPDAILNKPAALDEDEYAHMQRHATFSATIMRPLMRFRAYAEIAAWHHERWDGSGYPDGLAGEDIPLLARIVAIADAWDAMTGNRVYHQGLDPEVALDILEREADDGHFDPQLIRAFIAMVREERAADPSSESSAD